MPAQDRILIINTGGTMDSAYANPDQPPPTAVPLPKENSLLPEALKFWDLQDRCDIYTWHRGDSSRFLQPIEREHLRDLAAAIQSAPYSKVIITHGTDNMAVNAQQLLADLQALVPDGPLKTIAFTGALVPLANDERLYKPNTITLSDGTEVTMQRRDSDGLDNLKTAVTAVDRMANERPEGGVYIVFQHQIFDRPSDTAKVAGQFVSKSVSHPSIPVAQ